ncbi:phage protein [Lacticaseibacillus zhaodongensis]|uniref:phage protein n=1 Tax=Lacticaseibacillus zhaodongensis TaxID=2668065 RepID=UPI001E47176D|nr:hypothetical protein [Lacticaseibacillus zhaodongensis]
MTVQKVSGAKYNFEIRCEVQSSGGALSFMYGKDPKSSIEIHFDVPFSEQPEKNISEITLYNIDPAVFNKIKKGDKVTLRAGFTGDIGTLVEGTIFRTTVPSLEDADTAYVLRVLEGQDYSRYKKQHITFKKGSKASTIIKSVAAKAGIDLTYVSLKTDKTYKDGYTADGHPMDTLSDIADDCKTSLFYLRGKLRIQYIYGGANTGTFELTNQTGLLQSPTRESRDDDWVDDDDDDGLGKYSWSVDSVLNYKICPFSKATIKTPYVNTSMMVLNGEHEFDGDQPTTSFEAVQK